jgi:hypothetical protein
LSKLVGARHTLPQLIHLIEKGLVMPSPYFLNSFMNLTRIIPSASLILFFICFFPYASKTSDIANSLVPYLWEADSTFPSIGGKEKIIEYLDNLKKHSINQIGVQVEIYGNGTVTYKKSTLTHLPVAPRFLSDEWGKEDFLDFVIQEAGKREIGVFIKFHGSNNTTWDNHPDWRKVDFNGKEVLWSGKLKNFCVNSPYWREVFFPMVKEIALHYPKLKGFYLDTCQVMPVTANVCFCKYCRARFENETSKRIPEKLIDENSLLGPIIKLHAIKRVAWCNQFYEQFWNTIKAIRPNAFVLTNMGGGYHNYRDGFYSRHAAKYVTYITPEPVSTPRMYSKVYADKRREAGIANVNESVIAREFLNRGINTYGYNEFMIKTLRAECGDMKPVIPISRFWFTDGTMGPPEIEIGTIESGLTGGAKGYWFFGYIGNQLVTGGLTTTLWQDSTYISYLNNIRQGSRAALIAESQSANEIGILYDRDDDFWGGRYWENFAQVGGLYGLLQYQNKFGTDLIATSEPDAQYFGKSGYQLHIDILKRYRVIVVPKWDCVTLRDVKLLRRYVEQGGNLLLFGSLGRYDAFRNVPKGDSIYRKLGIKIAPDSNPAGELMIRKEHPIFTGLKMKESFTYSTSENMQTYQITATPDYEILAQEKNGDRYRNAILCKKMGKGTIFYFNSSDSKYFGPELSRIIANTIQWLMKNQLPLIAENFSETAIINLFKTPNKNLRYAHIFTVDPERNVTLKFRTDKEKAFKIAKVITYKNPKGEKIPVFYKNGYALVYLKEMTPYYAIVIIE